MTIKVYWHDQELEPKDIINLPEPRKAIAHRAVDIGGRRARSEALGFVRKIKQLAVAAAKRGERLVLGAGGGVDWTGHCLSVTVWGCTGPVGGERIVWEVRLESSWGARYRYKAGSTVARGWAAPMPYTCFALRADQLIRNALKLGMMRP